MRINKFAGVGLHVGVAAVACLTFAGTVAAKDVTVTLQVDNKGLDLSREKDAHKLYVRINRAAYVACASGEKVGLEPVADRAECIRKALAGAVRAVRAPLLTQIYLWNHTPQQAAAAGIEAPTQVAAK